MLKFNPRLLLIKIFIFLFSEIVYANEIKLNRYIYKETEELILNPDRGFYHQIGGNHRYLTTFDLSEPISQNYGDGDQSHNFYSNNATVYRVYFSLKNFYDKPIDTETLDRLKSLLKNAEAKNLTLILRFYYVWGYEKGRPFLSPKSEIIISHIKQISPILNQHSISISFLEAGFIGAWGEWHSDQYGNKKKFHPFRKQLLETLISELDKKIFIALRYPVDLQKVDNKEYMHRIGLHHDCPNYWNDTYPKVGAETYTSNTPQGGEVCQLKPRGQFGKSSDFEKFYGCKKMIPYFNKFNFYFLNGNDWSFSNSRFDKQGCWKKIRDKLGYRFILVGSKLINGDLFFEVKNVGFGKSFKSRKLSIKIGNKIIKTDIDVSRWKSGGTYLEKVHIGKNSETKGEIIIEGDIKFANTTKNLVFFN